MSEKWYVTADLHLDHPAILKYNPETRPFANIDEMNETIVRNWNSEVGRNDFVIIVGDLAYRNYAKWASILHGRKYLVLGNHDNINQEAKKHFIKVCEILEKRIYGQKCFFCHYPCLSWADKHTGAYMLHGHCHGRLAEDDTNKRCDVSMDVWGMHVVPLQVVFEKIRSKKPYPPFTDQQRKEMLERVERTRKENLAMLEAYRTKPYEIVQEEKQEDLDDDGLQQV